MKAFHSSAVRILAVSAAWLLACGCSTAPIVPPDAQVPLSGTYVIGPTDQIQVVVWKNLELSVTVPVRTDGKISVPLIDDVQAEGLTPEELKEVVTQSLSEYVTSPDVTVIVLQMNSHTASVIGEGIARRGLVPLRRDTTVLEALAQMGGFTTFAKTKKIKVLRRTDGGLKEYRFNYDGYVSGKYPDSNFILKPGDTIVVTD